MENEKPSLMFDESERKVSGKRRFCGGLKKYECMSKPTVYILFKILGPEVSQ